MKLAKKVLALAVALALVCCCGIMAFAADAATVSLTSKVDGDNVVVTASFVNAAGLKSFDFTVKYDATKLTYVKTKAAADAKAVADTSSPMTETPNDKTAGEVRVGGYFQESLDSQYFADAASPVDAANFSCVDITFTKVAGATGSTDVTVVINTASGATLTAGSATTVALTVAETTTAAAAETTTAADNGEASKTTANAKDESAKGTDTTKKSANPATGDDFALAAAAGVMALAGVAFVISKKRK